jgi:hypothetical protein
VVVIEEIFDGGHRRVEAVGLPRALAPAAVGLGLLTAPMAVPQQAPAAPMRAQAPQAQQAQQAVRVTRESVTRALSQVAGKPITFRTANLYKNGWNGYAEWDNSLVVIDYRLAGKLYALPAWDADTVEGTVPAFATLAHELGHVMSGSNLSEFAATRWGCNHLSGIASALGIRGPLAKRLVSESWRELNSGEGCRNRRDLRP